MTTDREDALASIEATIDHIERISRRRAGLTRVQTEAEEQVVHRIGRALATGHITTEDVIAAHARLHAAALERFSLRWDAAVSINSSSVRATRAREARRHEAGMSEGEWHGVRTRQPYDPVPERGVSVVYVLYDDHWSPLYVGSSAHMASRLAAHKKDKPFAYWRAWKCEDRDDAYRREDAMLRDLCPPLNRRAWR